MDPYSARIQYLYLVIFENMQQLVEHMPDQSEQSLVVNNAHISLASLKYRSPYTPALQLQDNVESAPEALLFFTVGRFLCYRSRYEGEGCQNTPPPKMPLWHKDYFQLKALGKKKKHKKGAL